MARKARSLEGQRVQVGIRLEKRMIKVLKGVAEYLDMSLNDLVEDMLRHQLEGKGASHLSKEHLNIVAELKKLYDMDCDTHAIDDWHEAAPPQSGAV